MLNLIGTVIAISAHFFPLFPKLIWAFLMYHTAHFWLLLAVYLLTNKYIHSFLFVLFEKKMKEKKEKKRNLSKIEHGSWDLTCVPGGPGGLPLASHDTCIWHKS